AAGQPAGWIVSGAGRLVTPAASGARTRAVRQFSVALRAGSTGQPNGVGAYSDTGARVQLRAERVNALAVADGTATIEGLAHVGAQSGVPFRLILTAARGAARAHARLDARSAPPISVDADVEAGSVRLI